MEKIKGRVLIAKLGLDGHDRGAKVVARALRDAGFEVIYSGLHQTPAAVAATAVDEDVDVLGVSILSGAHNALIPQLMEELKQREAEDVMIFVGGIIPDEDVDSLKACGVNAIFRPGSSLQSIVDEATAAAEKRQKNFTDGGNNGL